MVRGSVTVLLVVVATVLLFGQTQYFDRTYDLSYWEKADSSVGVDLISDVRLLPSSGYLCTGQSFFYGIASTERWIFKANRQGDTVWLKNYSISNSIWHSSGKIQPTNDGNFAISEVLYDTATDLSSYRLLKINGDGAKLWDIRHQYNNKDTRSRDITETWGGELIITGKVEMGTGQTQLYLAKYTADGSLIWENVYGGSKDEVGFSVLQSLDGNFFILGDTESYGSGGRDIFLVKIDEKGNKIWQKTYGGQYDDYGNSIARVGIQRKYLLAGVKSGNSKASSADGWLAHIDGDGWILWKKTYGDTNNNVFDGVSRLKNGQIITFGETWVEKKSNLSGWCVKMSPNGDSLWSRTYTKSGFGDYFYGFDETSDGGFVMGGSTIDTNQKSGVNQDAWLLKVDSMGCLKPGCAATPDTGDTIPPPDSINVYPNPFQDEAKFIIPKKVLPDRDPQKAAIKLTIYDMLGRRVQPSITIIRKTNWVELRLNGLSLASGVYIYQLHSGGAPIKTGKIVVQ